MLIHDATFNFNATLKLSNMGMFAASIESSIVTLYYKKIKIGTMPIPKLTTKANEPLIFTSSQTLKVTNRSQFELSISKVQKIFKNVFI